jgi:hypothetical protein
MTRNKPESRRQNNLFHRLIPQGKTTHVTIPKFLMRARRIEIK